MTNVIDYKKAKILRQIKEAARDAREFRARVQHIIDGILSADLSGFDDEQLQKIHAEIIELQAVLVRQSPHIFQRLESRVREL